MSASPLIKDLIKDAAEPISEDDLFAGQPEEEAAAEFAWLDEQSDDGSEDNKGSAMPVEDDGEFVEIDIDPIPTLYDVVEQTITFSPDDIQDEVSAVESVYEPASEAATQIEQPNPELSIEIEFDADPLQTDSIADLASNTDIDTGIDSDIGPGIEDEITVFDSVFGQVDEAQPQLEQTSSELSIELEFDAPTQTEMDAHTVADVSTDTDSDTQEVELSAEMLTMAAEAETQASLDASGVDTREVTDVTYADHYDAANQPPVPSLENVFNLASYKPVQLQRVLLGVAFTFIFIAGAALWRAIDGRVIVTELVPPMVYASIGVVIYLLGMRYLRIHFAQVRVGDKDWLLCEQVMVAAENGVMLKARFGTAYLVWEQLLGVAHDSDYYYLLIEPTQGFKVPKRGVSDPTLQVKLDDMASLTRAKSWQY